MTSPIEYLCNPVSSYAANPRNVYRITARNIILRLPGDQKVFQREKVLGEVSNKREAQRIITEFMSSPNVIDTTVDLDQNGEGIASYTKRFHSSYATEERERSFRYTYPQSLVQNPASKNEGAWVARRSSDSKYVRVSAAAAHAILNSSGTHDPSSVGDYLALWFVPKEYVAVRETLYRVEAGYLKPVWTWESGLRILPPYNWDTVIAPISE